MFLCWMSVIVSSFLPHLSCVSAGGGAGDESQINHTGLMDMSLQSLSHHGDAFGDEGRGFDLLGKSVSSFFYQD